MISTRHSMATKCVVGVFTASVRHGCGVTVDMNEDRNAGLATVGAMASLKTAQHGVCVACGSNEDDAYEPLKATDPYLPAITHTVHPFACTASEKDRQ